MKVKFILPALMEAKAESWRAIKYLLFPPLGLATLAGYLRDDDDAIIADEHVEPLSLDDDPDVVATETYVTSAHRCYAVADHYRQRGSHVVLGGLHATSLPEEALTHADTVVIGPAEEAWPRFLEDYRAGKPRRLYRSVTRCLANVPYPRRDLIKTRNYLVPNSIVVSRGCPHACDFCYKTSFFRGGASFHYPVMSRQTLESGYWHAYEKFYSLSGILRSALNQSTLPSTARHLAYTTAWKRVDPLWGLLIRLKQLRCAIPVLEALRARFSHHRLHRPMAGRCSRDPRITQALG